MIGKIHYLQSIRFFHNMKYIFITILRYRGEPWLTHKIPDDHGGVRVIGTTKQNKIRLNHWIVRFMCSST